MSYHSFKIYNQADFDNITKGIHLAQCMRSSTSRNDEDLNRAELRVEDLAISGTLACSFCNVQFGDQTQQRQHYKLDWHRYNLKQKLAGLQPVTEDNFDQHADDVSSISGTESDTEDESEPSGKSDITSNTDAYDTESETRLGMNTCALAARHAKVFFENADGQIFSVYKCLLHAKKDVPETDAKLVNLAQNICHKRQWAIIMLGGGHFAAAVFQGPQIIVHKTFHRYTVRAKQGGSQSSRDNRNGTHVKGAGASLRRYNEAALTQSIQEILESWSTNIKTCDLILYRAVGPHNRAVLFGGKQPQLNKTDVRLRTIPFATRRATFSEVKRVYDVLSSLELYGSADLFKTDFPASPNKRDKSAEMPKSDPAIETQTKMGSPKVESPNCRKRNNSRTGVINRAKSRELIQRPRPGQDSELSSSSSESDSETVKSNAKRNSLVSCEVEISFSQQLKQFENTIPNQMKQYMKGKPNKKKPKRRKPKPVINEALECFKKKIWSYCQSNDWDMVESTIRDMTAEIESRNATNANLPEPAPANNVVEESDINHILNASVDDSGNTLLHNASVHGHTTLICVLMKYGSNPCTKNKRNQTPYAATVDKATRVSFRKFLAENPDKYDYGKSQIPGPINEELEKEQVEKKKLIKKAKREKEKEKRKERVAERFEQEEKERFSQLSDREKRALAAERRMLQQNSSAVLRRCFLCGTDISRIVPFEYSQNCFCSMPCLKVHRLQHGSVLS